MRPRAINKIKMVYETLFVDQLCFLRIDFTSKRVLKMRKVLKNGVFILLMNPLSSSIKVKLDETGAFWCNISVYMGKLVITNKI